MRCKNHATPGVCTKCTPEEQTIRYDPDAENVDDSNQALFRKADMIVVDYDMIEHQAAYPKSDRMGLNSPPMKASEAAKEICRRLIHISGCELLVIVTDNRDKETAGPHREELGKSGKRASHHVKMDDAAASKVIDHDTLIHPYTQINSNGRRAWRKYMEKYMFNELQKRKLEPAASGREKKLLIIGSYHDIYGDPDIVSQLQMNTSIDIESDTRTIRVLETFNRAEDGTPFHTTLVYNNDGDFIAASDIVLPQHADGNRLYWCMGRKSDPILDLTCLFHRNKNSCGLMARLHQQVLVYDTDYGNGTPYFRDIHRDLPMFPALSVSGDVVIIDLERLHRITQPLLAMPNVREQTVRALFMALYYIGWAPSPYEFGWKKGGTYELPDGLVPKELFSWQTLAMHGEIRYLKKQKSYAVRL